MQILVTRFHLLLLTVTLAMTGVGVLRIPDDFVFLAHWSGNSADWLWPRLVIFVAPAIQFLLMVIFFLLGRLLTKNQYAKAQHILQPALTALMGVVAATQLGLLLSGIGSDLDFVRVTGFALGAALLLLGVVLYEAERHTYAGLRMPWPVRSDLAWRIVHRATGMSYGLGGVCVLGLAWLDAGMGMLILSFAAAILVPAVVAGLATVLFLNR
ncbi:SdpI family protein [Devosia ginsengisoli]|uniref:SdpI family protein n=1 Tax=Devosia ginsengisoli TaxID=400770 RepID=UPI0026EFECAD|nr:SdpI family protein [Devosia ginsengisoli]MCR6672905.1 SdpI family protein [Devosia ginsengisoli]